MVIKVVKSSNDCMQKVSHKICTNYSRTTFPFAELKVCITSTIVEITVLSIFFGVFTLNSYTLPLFQRIFVSDVCHVQWLPAVWGILTNTANS